MAEITNTIKSVDSNMTMMTMMMADEVVEQGFLLLVLSLGLLLLSSALLYLHFVTIA